MYKNNNDECKKAIEMVFIIAGLFVVAGTVFSIGLIIYFLI